MCTCGLHTASDDMLGARSDSNQWPAVRRPGTCKAEWMVLECIRTLTHARQLRLESPTVPCAATGFWSVQAKVVDVGVCSDLTPAVVRPVAAGFWGKPKCTYPALECLNERVGRRLGLESVAGGPLYCWALERATGVGCGRASTHPAARYSGGSGVSPLCRAGCCLIPGRARQCPACSTQRCG